MRRWKPLTVLTVLAALGTVGTVRAGAPPNIDPVAASFTAGPTSLETTFCPGVDGEYRQDRNIVEGSVDSEDPRLTGDLRLQLFAMTNLTTEQGWVVANTTITDPPTGEVKVQGRFFSVGLPFTQKGVFFGQVSPTESLPGGTLMANASFDQDPQTLEITGEIGSAMPFIRGDPAVIQSGTC